MKALEDHLTKKLADGVINAAKQIFTVVLIFIFASAATATDPYFRKRLGERYFTPGRAFMSLVSWSIITAIPEYPYLSQNQKVPTKYLIIGGVVFWSYLILALIRLRGIRKRRFAGEIWHSKSRGESVFGSENAPRDLAIEIALTAVLCLFSHYCAVFFALSRLMGYMADAAARAEFYNRYLDIQDAKIEAEYMETALREGLAPDHTLGIFNPLPKGFKGEHRANIARVVTAAQFDTATANEAPITPNPAVETPQAPSAVVENLKKIGGQVFRATLGSKRFLTLCVVAILAFGLVKGGIFLFHTGYVKWSQHVLASATSAQPVKQVDTKPVTPTPAETSAPQPASTPDQPQKDVAAAAATAAQAQEEQRIRERNQIIQQIKTTVDNELAQVATFRSNCLTRLNNNTNRIAKASYFSRKAFAQRNEDERRDEITELNKQESILTQDEQSMQDLITDPGTDAQLFYNSVKEATDHMEINRQRMTANLDALDSGIAQASTKTPLVQMKVK